MQNIHSFIGKPTQNSLLMSSQSMMKQPSRQFQCAVSTAEQHKNEQIKNTNNHVYVPQFDFV